MNDPTTVVTRGSTYENRANLAASFLDKIVKKYEGTRLGRQELEAEVLTDNPGALWKRVEHIDAFRVREAPDLMRIVVAIDPAVTSKPGSDETGIIVAGIGIDGHGYVLDDNSGIYTPGEWAARARTAFYQWRADRIVAEVNNGGDLVEANVRTVDTDIPYKSVHASRGKVIRAEPVSGLYEQGRVHHVGAFGTLEDQLTGWSPMDEKSPDRLDALVWGITELMLVSEQTSGSYDGLDQYVMSKPEW